MSAPQYPTHGPVYPELTPAGDAQALLHAVATAPDEQNLTRVLHCLAAVDYLQRLDGPVAAVALDTGPRTAIRAALSLLADLPDELFEHGDIQEACAHAQRALCAG